MRDTKAKTNLGLLSTAMLIGTIAVGMPANADNILGDADIDLKNKPIETPTLDYLKDNNILIPQKGEYNSSNKTWAEGEPITSPGSAYKVTEGTETNHNFKYQTVDEDGNITTKYYNVNLKEADDGSVGFGTSENVKWTTSSSSAGSVTVKLPNSYTYTTPEGYANSTRIENPTNDNDVNNKEFRNQSAGEGTGGAINNASGTVENIVANFINNSAREGAAIYNKTTLVQSIIGDFIANVSSGSKSGTGYGVTVNYNGGALYNSGTIETLRGDFIRNKITTSVSGYDNGSATSSTKGSAIYNSGTIEDIAGDFIGNSASSSLSYVTSQYKTAIAEGGAIYNQNKINKITGNFISNSTFSSISSCSNSNISSYSYGGAIYNSSSIGDIIGDFINNSSLTSNGMSSYGGAIYNQGTIINIIGNFISNRSSVDYPISYSYSSIYSYGGAIYNERTIGNITGDFIGNSASSNYSSSSGGAIYNSGTIGNITGDFISNKSSSGSYSSSGGAIYNSGTIGDITGDFIGNASSGSSSSSGGAIYNKGTIGNITGDFIGNSSSGSSSYGGAIYNYKTIGNITGNFISNTTSSQGGAIYNSSSIGDITGDFIGNSSSGSSSYGGAIYNVVRIGDITGDFIGNSSPSYGGAIYNSRTIGNVTSDFIGNTSSSSYGGAIYNSGTIGNVTGDFIGNSSSGSSSVYGGAIYNTGTIGAENGGIINSNFYNNNAASAYAQGGAIYTSKDLNIIADNGTSTFKGNYVQVGSGEKDYQAIYVAAETGKSSTSASSLGLSYDGAIYNTTYTASGLNFLAKNNGQITLNDKVSGDHAILYRWNSSSEKDSTIDKWVYTCRNLDENYNETSVYKYWNEGKSDSTLGKYVYTYHILDTDDNETSVHKYWSEGKSDSTIDKYIYTDHILDADGNETSTHRYWSESSNGIYTYHILDENGRELNTIKSFSSNFILALNTPEVTSYYSEESYNVNITGDATGIVNLYNDLVNANVKTDTVTVNLANNDMHNYVVNKLTSDANTKYVIDIDLLNKTSDKITTTTESSGIVTLDLLRIANDIPTQTPDLSYKIQILDTPTDSLQLALSDRVQSQLPTDEYKIGVSVEEFLDEIQKTTNWDDEYSIYEQESDVYGRLGLATTNTTNDSIGVTITRKETGDIEYKGSQGDTLALWNGLDTEETKNFNFDAPENVYVVASKHPDVLGVGETKGSDVNVNGVISETGERSTIDFNNRKGFEVKDSLTLNINNVNLTKANGDNGSVIEATDTDSTINLTNVNLIKNTSTSQGGAINSKSNVNIISDNATTTLSDNYAKVGTDKIDDNAIYIAGSDKTLNFQLKNSGKIVLEDNVRGENGYRVNIKGDNIDNTVFYLHNDLYKSNLTLSNTTIHTSNNDLHVYDVEKLTVTSDTNFVADVDLKNKEMDRFTANKYGKHTGNLNVVGMNLLSDADPNEKVTAVYFAQPGLKNNVTNGTSELPDDKYQDFEAYTPIYKYNVSYDNQNEYDGKGDGGYFLFKRGGTGTGGNPSDSFNPSILSTPVSSVAASQATINETFKYVFEHADAFTKLPQSIRLSRLNANKYALNETNPYGLGSSTDFDGNRGSLCY
ncbi:hypothetical protein HDR58_07810, partial [bacterium]|nr:hypothetical protein [bacterium]